MPDLNLILKDESGLVVAAFVLWRQMGGKMPLEFNEDFSSLVKKRGAL